MIVEQKVEYSTALIAKKKGFNEKCLFFYNGDVLVESGGYNTNQLSYKYSDRYCTAPTQSLLQRWFRDKYNIHISVKPFFIKGEFQYYEFRIHYYGIVGQNNTYEKSLEMALEEALQLIKKETNENN